ncbi:ABC transporter permease [Kitasatospora phosalacinea]|uniref:ABC transporter permease n=1 Tax=Kitasatospora phosalacinea TaxID=2065 RepID=UPI00365D7247
MAETRGRRRWRGVRHLGGPGLAARARLIRVVPLGEIQFPVSLANTAFSLTLQLYLYYCLWNALYAGAGEQQATARTQIISFSLLGVLLSRTRWGFSASRRDTIAQRVRDGSIVHWYVRPLEPRKFAFWLYLGDSAYRVLWLVPGWSACVALGALAVPRDLTRLAVALVSIVLGQVILYYLSVLVDLTCFWTTSNTGIQRLNQFAQEILSGSIVPLWLLPSAVSGVAGALPFAAAVNTPLSLYSGRTPESSVPGVLLLQCVWIVVLGTASRWVWRSAGRRVAVQGG